MKYNRLYTTNLRYYYYIGFMEWFYEYYWLTLPLTALLIIWIIKKIGLGLKKLFRSIRQIKYPNQTFKNIFKVLLIIVLFWAAYEVGGDMYSFNEVFNSMILTTIAICIMIFGDW